MQNMCADVDFVSICCTREFFLFLQAQLKTSELGETVDQVEFLIKRHDAFESLLAKQNTKLENLQESGKRLIDQQHFDAPAISDRVRNVTQRRQNVKDLSDERHRKLADSLLYAQFNRDCLEAEGWIEDKIKVATEEQFSTATDLYDKMRKLQKHQAFEAEIMANAPQIKSIKEVGSIISGDYVCINVNIKLQTRTDTSAR